MEVRKERTGWRDNILSFVHKENNIKMYDFLVSEYDHGKSVAIVNYVKKGEYSGRDYNIIKYTLARKNKEPYFTAIYDYIIKDNEAKITEVRIIPENFYAQNKGYKDITTDEKGFIEFLYKIRNRKISDSEINEILSNPLIIDKCLLNNTNIMSLRHRSYGWNAPCVDIDCMMTEKGKPYLFIEYKESNSKFEIKGNMADNALSDLGCCKDQLPVLLVRYKRDKVLKTCVDFEIDDGFNEFGKKIVNSLHNKKMSVEDYMKYIKDPDNFKEAA